MSASPAKEDEFFSDEDMFSPKKRIYPEEYPEVLAARCAPGTKHILVDRFRKLLTGIPPPPDHTNPDFQLDKMLALWYSNQRLVWEGASREKPSEEETDARIYQNVDNSCEEFENLGRHICERFIWSETSAVSSTVFIKLTQSAKKRRKTNGWGKSPKTRISYLTRRMTTFHKDNIASAVASSKSTQILINKNNSKKGVGGKGADIKGKRALFTSPDNLNKFRTPDQGKNRRLMRRLLVNSSPVNKGKTRETDENVSRSSERRRCSRSLFNASTDEANAEVDKKVENTPYSLSKEHRQKMLWAVSNALKAVKVRMVDPEFKIFASQLFKATVSKWRPNTPCSGNKKVSTSDAMLATAKGLVEGITGRMMSPKSAKKSGPKMEDMEKSPLRDENEPPPIQISPIKTQQPPPKASDEAGIFPLDAPVSDLDPGRTTPNKVNNQSSPKEVALKNDELPSSTRKRKREDSTIDRHLVVNVPHTTCTRQLRSNTPIKSTPSKLSCQVVNFSTPQKTPSKNDETDLSVVKSINERTPENVAKKRVLSEWKSPDRESQLPLTRMVTRQLAQCTPTKTPKSSDKTNKRLTQFHTPPIDEKKNSSDDNGETDQPSNLRFSLRRRQSTTYSESPLKKSTP